MDIKSTNRLYLNGLFIDKLHLQVNFYLFIPGESLYVTLYGVSIDVNVRLDKNTVKLENTFISSASQR